VLSVGGDGHRAAPSSGIGAGRIDIGLSEVDQRFRTLPMPPSQASIRTTYSVPLL